MAPWHEIKIADTFPRWNPTSASRCLEGVLQRVPSAKIVTLQGKKRTVNAVVGPNRSIWAKHTFRPNAPTNNVHSVTVKRAIYDRLMNQTS